MKNGWMDDRKVDLAIGFPGFSRATLKTLGVSVVLSGNLNAAFELPFVFGVCVMFYHALNIIPCPGVEGYNLCLPPAHQCQ